jgi:hypothetical protein
MSTYIKNTEKSQINDLMLHLTSQTPRKQKQVKPKTSRQREIIKIGAEINELETKKKYNKTKSWFFEKVNKID